MKPILYSFRRCPYAIRARLAIAASAVEVELREVVLRDKPPEMLAISPKGTVPVLQLSSGEVFDESIDVMRWALHINDPFDWLCLTNDQKEQTLNLIKKNDGDFKKNLDLYKYASRHPENPPEYYRQSGEQFLKMLEPSLQKQKFLVKEAPSFVDYAIFPFIRQFAFVDMAWFEQSEYTALQAWLDYFLKSDLFSKVMHKHKPWKAS